jgi:transcriptional regulator with XRE-family HTH domain
VGARLRLRREQLGLTVRETALRVGLRPSSASYLSQLESGAKTPHPDLARRLAEALGDDPRIYLAWSATGRRSDPLATARAVRTLAELLRHPGYDLSPAGPAGVGDEVREVPAAVAPLRDPPGGRDAPGVPALGPAPSGGAVPGAKLLVPELEEGADPGEPGREPRPAAMHRIAPETLGAVEPLQRPFAYRLSEPGTRRVPDLLAPGDVALLTRRVWPPEASAAHAVRLSGHVVLARVLWNERQLLLLPGPGGRDFLVLDAPDRTTVERLLAGRVVATLRPAG